jgi:CheY-like chemotaxis protein
MRLDFNVLWVDDQPKGVKAQHEQIGLKLRKQGFRLTSIFARSVAEATKHISNDVYADHVDLILMDYDLGKGPTGADGLVAVRSMMPYKEIVFYSAQAPDLRKMLLEAKVDGVHVSDRGGLINDVVGIFEMLVKKVIDIEHSRGIVMGATSEIDHTINDCLVRYFDRCKKDDQIKILAAVTKRLGEIKARFEAECGELDGITHVSALAPKHGIYTSADRLNLLRKILAVLNIHADKKKKLISYGVNVVPRRNDLAHVRVKVEGFVRKLLNRDNRELTSEDMRLLRVEILECRELFEEMQASLDHAASRS